jgi:hypothetical protein
MALALPSQAQVSTPPLPPPRPDRPAPPEVKEQPAKPEEKPAPDAPKTEAPAEQKDPKEAEAEAACLERLTKLGIKFEKRPPVKDNECEVDNPVLVSGLPQEVKVAPDSLMACPLAENLARWLNDVVQPEAGRQFQAAPKKLLIGTSYQCRNQTSAAKLSEHAFGNGVDVMGFEFDKRAPLAIDSHAEGSPEAAFQAFIRKEACPIFTTVLGPGSDAEHGNHLHLDLRVRKADYRICQ